MLNTCSEPPAPLAGTSLRLDDDQRRLIEQVRRFSRERLEPLLTDPTTDRRREEVIRLSGQLDLGATILPEAHGGLGVDALDLCLLLEETATGPLDLAAEITLSVPALAIAREFSAIGRFFPFGVEAYFGGASAMCVAVPGSHRGAAFVLTRRQGDSLLVPAPAGQDGRRLVLLHPDEAHTLLSRGSVIAELSNLRVIQIQMSDAVGEQERSYALSTSQQQRYLGWYSLWLAALLNGAIRSAVAFAFAYAQTRVTFQKPLIHHQAVSLRLADMALAADGTKLVLWDAAARFSCVDGLPVGDLVALIRHLGTTSLEIHRDAVQICGAHGYVEGYPPARRFQVVTPLALLLLQVARTLQSPADR